MALGFDTLLDDDEPDTSDWRAAARQLLDSLKLPQFSRAGLDEIKRREGGFVPDAYPDTAGQNEPNPRYAIGYGLRTYQGQPVKAGMSITQQQADDEFQRQIDTDYNRYVRQANVPLGQNQRDALLSVAFNHPETAKRIVAKLNAGQPISQQDFTWSATYGGKPNQGLLDRRNAEYAQFNAQDTMLEPGNIDLFKQPKVQNPDGSVSTVDSFSVNIDGAEVLLPTVLPDGRHVTPDQAVQEYRRTGQHLGKFTTPQAATAYAQQLHDDYAAGKYDVPDWRDEARQLLAEVKFGPAGPEWETVAGGLHAPAGPPPVPPSASDLEKEIIRASHPSASRRGMQLDTEPFVGKPETPVTARSRTGQIYQTGETLPGLPPAQHPTQRELLAPAAENLNVEAQQQAEYERTRPRSLWEHLTLPPRPVTEAAAAEAERLRAFGAQEAARKAGAQGLPGFSTPAPGAPPPETLNQQALGAALSASSDVPFVPPGQEAERAASNLQIAASQATPLNAFFLGSSRVLPLIASR